MRPGQKTPNLKRGEDTLLPKLPVIMRLSTRLVNRQRTSRAGNATTRSIRLESATAVLSSLRATSTGRLDVHGAREEDVVF